MKIFILSACLLFKSVMLTAQVAGCSPLAAFINTAREGAEQVIFHADAPKTPKEMLANILPCLAMDKNTWSYRMDTTGSQNACHLYSSDSLYGWIGMDDGLQAAVLKLEKFTGASPISFAPAAWTSIPRNKNSVRAEATSTQKNTDMEIDDNTVQMVSYYCRTLATLLNEARVNFKNISVAYKHNAYSTLNYPSTLTMQENIDNNYIQADADHHFFRYTEFIDDDLFFYAIRACRDEGVVLKDWVIIPATGETMKYKKGSTELLIQHNTPKSKKPSTVLVITQNR